MMYLHRVGSIKVAPFRFRVEEVKRKRASARACLIGLVCMSLLFVVSGDASAQSMQRDVSDEQFARSDLAMGIDGDGYTIMVWGDSRDNELFFGSDKGSAIYGQIVDADFNFVGGNFRITERPGASALDLNSIGMLVMEDGRYVVVWTHADRDDGGTFVPSIMMTMRHRDGAILVPETVVAGGGTERDPRISRAAADLLITWTTGAAPERQRQARLYSANTANPRGQSFTLDAGGLDVGGVTQFGISDTSYAVVYGARYLQYYNAEHDPAGPRIDIQDHYDATDYWPALLGPVGTDSLIVGRWSRPNHDRIAFHFADASGRPLSERIVISDSEPLQLISAVQYSAGTSGLLFVWEDRRNSFPVRLNASVADIYAQRFDLRGNPIGSNFKVNHEPREMHQARPRLLHLSHDRFIATWWENRLLTCPQSLYYAVNIQRSYQVGTFVDFHHPDPGPVRGWESYVEDIQRICETGELPIIVGTGLYPNPSSGVFTLAFEVNVDMVVDIEIAVFDMMGRRVAREVVARTARGAHSATVSLPDVPAGTYFVRVSSGAVRGVIGTYRVVIVR
jgi:hypothetical protein